MYKIKFLQYNYLMREVLSERDTLDNIIDVSLDGRPTKEEKLHLTSAEKWAKYAFEHDKEYHMIVEKDNQLFAHINFYFTGISISFLTHINGEWFEYLSLDYDRKYYDEKNDTSLAYPNSKLFFRQFNLYQRNDKELITEEVLFKDEGIMNILTVKDIIQPERKTEYEEKETPVNISNNWIDAPKNYKDFLYLLDYKNIINDEKLNF